MLPEKLAQASRRSAASAEPGEGSFFLWRAIELGPHSLVERLGF
jgi:hypothetical protein